MYQTIIDRFDALCTEMYLATLHGTYGEGLTFKDRVRRVREDIKTIPERLVAVKLTDMMADMLRLAECKPGSRRFVRIKKRVFRDNAAVNRKLAEYVD